MYVICYGDGQLPERAYYGSEDEAMMQAAADVAAGRGVAGIHPSAATHTPTDPDAVPELGAESKSSAQVQAAADTAVDRLAAAEAELAEARAALGY